MFRKTTIFYYCCCFFSLTHAQNGYFYPKPPFRAPVLTEISPVENINNSQLLLADATTSVVKPNNVSMDFIDDLIVGAGELLFGTLFTSRPKPPKQKPTSNNINNNNNNNINNVDNTDNGKLFVTSNKKCTTCSCGVPNINRIVGGTEVQTNKYPWITQLIRRGRFFCGGTLINDRYVITAAHCVFKMNVRMISVRLLQVNRTSSTDLGITRQVAYAIVHENYSPTTVENDIALLKLDQMVPLLDPIRPVCLPSSKIQTFERAEGIVAGWGLTHENGLVSSILQEAQLPIITNAECMATSYKTMITETMLCAGYVETGGKDACQGDSGGPLIVNDQRIFRLAGIVSYGYGCAKPNAPGVYTRVSMYLDWIANNTKDACYCDK